MSTKDGFKNRQLHMEDYLRVIPAEQGRETGVFDYRRIAEDDNTITDFWTDNLLELITRTDNLNKAYLQVKRNKGKGGIDGMQVDGLLPYLREHQFELIQQLREGKYKPNPVRRVEIPKEEKGKVRKLGIPTVVDRVVQQAIAQELTPLYEVQFSEHSYGFRPKRGAHDALKTCIKLVNEGYVYVVSMDLASYFDTVNHSKLIEVLSRTIKDGRVISLIHKYLNAGVMADGRFERTEEGVPQGGPLSPLLGNVMLNELDKELERRGHRFVRYADDCMRVEGMEINNLIGSMLQDYIEPFNVIYQTAEDGMGDTIKPRLVEAGADLSRVMVIDDSEEALTLSDDRIEKAVRQNHVRLVIIDPVQAFIGADVDMNRANEVRPVFRKLGMIAEKTGCAIVLIGHLNKSSGTQSTYRGLGSIDIMAAARSLIFIGKVRKDPTTRVLIHEKSSIAPPGETMAFKLGDEEGFRWVGAYEISADELLDEKEGKATETKLERGAKLIRELLADKKEISIRELDEKAKEQGISGRTMRDVRSRMKNELEYQVNEKQENSIRLKE